MQSDSQSAFQSLHGKITLPLHRRPLVPLNNNVIVIPTSNYGTTSSTKRLVLPSHNFTLLQSSASIIPKSANSNLFPNPTQHSVQCQQKVKEVILPSRPNVKTVFLPSPAQPSVPIQKSLPQPNVKTTFLPSAHRFSVPIQKSLPQPNVKATFLPSPAHQFSVPIQKSLPNDVIQYQEQQVVEEVLPDSCDIYLDSETFIVEKDFTYPLKDHDLLQARAAASSAAADRNKPLGAPINATNISASSSKCDSQPADSSSEDESENELFYLASESEDECFVDEYVNLKKTPPKLKEIYTKERREEKDPECESEDKCFVDVNLKKTPPKEINTKEKSKLTRKCEENDSESDSSLSDAFVPKKPHIRKIPTFDDTDDSGFKPSKGSSSAEKDQPSPIQASKDKVLSILPKEYDYKIVYAQEISNDKFEQIVTKFRVNVSKVDDIEKWVNSFELSSNTNFRVEHTRKPKTSKRVLFKKIFRCHHNTLAEKSKTKKPHEKHIKCPSKMTVTLKNKDMESSKDVHLKSHPCEVYLKSIHNHATDAAAGDILRHRRPCLETRKKFSDMFKNTIARISPAYAMDRNLEDIEEEDPDLFRVGDGAFVPERPWVYKLYNKIMKDKCGEPYGPGMISALEKYVDNYNTECGELCAKLGSSEDGNHHFVAVCSPMMKRIHTHHKGSGEVMFIDSSGCMDNCNARVFVILTPSVVCGLPLGLLITFSEREDVVTAALELWKEILPEKAFHGRGLQGPKLIISDDSFCERNSLRACFPEAVLLLCLFHVLQAMWRYIWDSTHGVLFEYKAYVYFLFREIIYAPTIEKFNEAYEQALQDEVLLSCPIVKKHFEDLKLRAKEWALCHRCHLLTRGHHTNNFCEACMRVIKDSILHRSRAYNTVQLLDLLLCKLDLHFKRKLAFVVNNRIRASRSYKYRIKAEKLIPLRAERLFSCEHLFKVVNIAKKTEYIVDSQLEICSCPVGMCGAQKFQISHHQFLPTSDPSFRMVLFYIMTGHTNVPAGFLKTLKGCNEEFDLSTIPEFQEDSPGGNDYGMEVPAASTTENKEPLQQHDAESLKEEIRNVAEDLCPRLSSSQYLSEPCDKFVKSYWSIVNKGNFESTLASALATFSKDQTSLIPISKQKVIPLQSTAPARRTVFKGRSNQAQLGGRPNKVVSSQIPTDHGYAPNNCKRIAPAEATWAVRPVKRAKVPHSLTACVNANARLPK